MACRPVRTAQRFGKRPGQVGEARDGRRQSYEDLEQRSHLIQGEGFAIRAAALEDIVASKEWANRPKDQEALGELHAIMAGEVAN